MKKLCIISFAALMVAFSGCSQGTDVRGKNDAALEKASSENQKITDSLSREKELNSVK